ncbi:helix-turn-helix domain-containing protein [Candidatus Omnitrophota bacterium]
MTTTKEIGRVFREAREERQLSADEVGRSTRIHVNVIKDIESGVFDRIGAIYLKSFLKKYSDFLGLDTESIIGKYESISSSIPNREFNVDIDIEEPEDKENPFATPTEKKIQMALVAFLSVVLVVLVFILIGMMRARLSSQVTRKARVEEMASKPAQTVKKVTKTETKPAVVAKKTAPVKEIAGAVNLTLKARGEVWLRVSHGEKRLFDGFLKNGDTKSWKADGPITIWTGKADMLDFTVNGRQVGTVAAGVVRNIKVSSEGVQIGDSWVKRIK